MLKPKLGFVLFGHKYFDSMVNKASFQEEALVELSELDIEIVKIDGIPATKSTVLEAADLLRKEDVDGVIINASAYGSEELACIFAQDLLDCPILLWSMYGGEKAFIPVTTIFSLSSNLQSIGRDFSHLLGDLKDEETKRGVMAFAMAAATAKRLRRSSIGVVGPPCPGMIDTTYSDSHLRRVVPDILYLDTIELSGLLTRVEEDRARTVLEDVKEKVGRMESTDKQMLDSARSYLAMKAMVEKHDLNAITIREWPEIAEQNFSMCLGSALLSDEGIICGAELDLPITLTGLAMFYLTGKSVYIGEIDAVDPERNVAFFCNDGSIAFSLAKGSKDIVLTDGDILVMLSCGRKEGLNLRFAVKPGRVTIARLSGHPTRDRLKMGITCGEVIEILPPPVGDIRTAHVKFDVPLPELMNTWIAEGFGHHMAIVHADIKDELSFLCDILKVEKVIL